MQIDASDYIDKKNRPSFYTTKADILLINISFLYSRLLMRNTKFMCLDLKQENVATK